MILEPIIQVECDECGEIVEIRLKRIGKDQDDKKVKIELKQRGWELSTDMGNETFCSVGCRTLYEEDK